MLRTIRTYVTWNFLVTLGFCLFLVLGLTVMLDFVQRADDFSELLAKQNQSWRFVVTFYLIRLPMFASWLFPIILLTAAGVTLIRMNKNNELIPLLMAGISMHQILLPLYVLFVAGGIGVFCMQEWVLPSFSSRIARTKQLLKSGEQLDDVLVVDDRGRYLHGRSYQPSTRVLNDVTVMVFRENVLREIISANRAVWTSKEEGAWILKDGRRTRFDERGFRAGAPVTYGKEGFRWRTSITPHQILTRDEDIKFYSLRQLNQLISEWPHLITLRMTRQARFVYPFICILLPLFSVPIILQREITSYFKGGVLIAGITIGFYLIQVVFLKLGTAGVLHPIPAGWTPLLLGICLFVYLKDRIIT